MAGEIDLRAATIESARWYILRALDAGRPDAVNEDILYRTLDATHVKLSPKELRRELDYLQKRGCIQIDDEEADVWGAELTQLGVDLVQYTVDIKPGIARPPKRI